MKIAVLTGGGHVSALNAGIEGITKEAVDKGWDVLGALDGWEGLEKGDFVNLTKENTDSIKGFGGSILGSGRWKPYLDAVQKTVKENEIDGVIALGGDDTLGVLDDLWEDYEVPAVGWPKTMDNDLGATYFSLGYPTAVKNAVETVLNSFDIAWTHGRIAMISVFGRSTDWVAAGAGAYGDADMVLPGEKPTRIDEIYEKIKEIYFENENDKGKPYATMVIAEGASIEGLETHVKRDDMHVDEFGHPKLDPNYLVSSLSDTIREKSKEDLGKQIKTAPISLTYQLRNGKPLEIDEQLGYECGKKCVELLDNERPGRMAIVEENDGELEVGDANLSEGVEVSMVSETDYIDYENLSIRESFFDYADPFMGEKGERQIHLLDRREYKAS
ncbi:MAG: 6-phosphofructokinase [Candidatus Hadarchaeia archaeon]